MQFGYACMECIVHRYSQLAQKKGDHDKGVSYVKEIMNAMITAPKGVAMPYLSPAFAAITERYYGADGADYEKGKRQSNTLMLSLLPTLRQQVQQAADPLRTAMALAQIGNYIDFTALYGKVNFDELQVLLQDTDRYLPDITEYRQLCGELAEANRLVYICDNAGEIVADLLVAEQLAAMYPSLSLTFAVRGLPTVNDALRDDAMMVGLDRFGSIIDNGSGISGTEFGYLGREMQDALLSADIIVAKGQGNFETMLGCGLNVYYSFLCKCARFSGFFGVAPLTGMFVNERRLKKESFTD